MFWNKSRSRRDVEVLSSPAFANRDSNPYNSLIFDQMVKGRANVVDYSDIRLLLKPCDILHIHWPEYFFFFTDTSTVRMIFKTSIRLFCLYISLLKGTKVFWTIHNLNPHEKRRPRLEKIVISMMVSRVNSLIVLNHDSHKKICERYPKLIGKPVSFIPSCHYRTVYHSVLDKDEAKTMYGIGKEYTVLGYFGRIRPYKNVPEMIRAFKNVRDQQVRLLISGECSDASLKQEIVSLASEDKRIHLCLEDLTPEQLANVVTACDLAVLPYKSVLNSGTAFLSLSLNRPLLLPETEAFSELADTIGDDWVRMYKGEITGSDLLSALDWVRKDSGFNEVGLEQFHPRRIADTTLAAYEATLHRV